jgi:hypothetical protein
MFEISEEVKDPKQLIGWGAKNGFLDNVLDKMFKLKQNPIIVAERATGKSSLLNCIQYKINEKNDNHFGVLINFTDYIDDLNHDTGYNLITASIIDQLDKEKNIFRSNLYKRIIRNNTLHLGDFTINKESNIGDYIEQFNKYRRQKSKTLFKDLIIFLAEQSYSIVLLIDEYERMYFDVFDGKPGSFYPVRNFITGSTTLPNGQRLRCCMTGNRQWSDYYNRTGSEDFNRCKTIFLPSLTKDDTKSLIEYGLDKFDKHNSKLDYENIFDFSGGNPYTIKILFNELIQNPASKIDDHLMDDHFHVRWNKLEEKDIFVNMKKILIGCVRGDLDQSQEDTNTIKYMVNLQLIEKNEDGYIPKGLLWEKFLKDTINADVKDIIEENFNMLSKSMETNESEDKDRENTEIKVKTQSDTFHDLISDITTNLRRKRLDPIFDLQIAPEMFAIAGNLKNPCFNKDGFAEFIYGIYQILWYSTSRTQIQPRIYPDETIFQNNDTTDTSLVIKLNGFEYESGGQAYRHTQSSASTSWSVSHNLDYQYPAITVYDGNDDAIIPEKVKATNSNTLTLTFTAAESGYAHVSVGGGQSRFVPTYVINNMSNNDPATVKWILLYNELYDSINNEIDVLQKKDTHPIKINRHPDQKEFFISSLRRSYIKKYMEDMEKNSLLKMEGRIKKKKSECKSYLNEHIRNEKNKDLIQLQEKVLNDLFVDETNETKNISYLRKKIKESKQRYENEGETHIQEYLELLRNKLRLTITKSHYSLGKFPRTKASMPSKFNKWPTKINEPLVLKRIDNLRHYYCAAHMIEEEGFTPSIPFGEVLDNYLGTYNEPEEQSQWLNFQLAVLKDINPLLREIKDWAYNQVPRDL